MQNPLSWLNHNRINLTDLAEEILQGLFFVFFRRNMEMNLEYHGLSELIPHIIMIYIYFTHIVRDLENRRKFNGVLQKDVSKLFALG